jgi:hypothetical protein
MPFLARADKDEASETRSGRRANGETKGIGAGEDAVGRPVGFAIENLCARSLESACCWEADY